MQNSASGSSRDGFATLWAEGDPAQAAGSAARSESSSPMKCGHVSGGRATHAKCVSHNGAGPKGDLGCHFGQSNRSGLEVSHSGLSAARLRLRAVAVCTIAQLELSGSVQSSRRVGRRAAGQPSVARRADGRALDCARVKPSRHQCAAHSAFKDVRCVALAIGCVKDGATLVLPSRHRGPRLLSNPPLSSNAPTASSVTSSMTPRCTLRPGKSRARSGAGRRGREACGGDEARARRRWRSSIVSSARRGHQRSCAPRPTTIRSR